MIEWRRYAERVAKDATRLIGGRWGESFPFYYVSEFPKSGGTWLARMAADYLQLPFPQHTVFPIGASAVIQNHWDYQPRLRRVFYIYRDGRDVMTSYFFDRIRVARHSDEAQADHLDRVYSGLFGKDYDPGNVVELLPRFIDHEFSNPGRGSPVSWADHVRRWYYPTRTHIAYLSYEELLADCAGTLGAALQQVTGEPVVPWRIEATVEKFSWERQTGRKRGEEDQTQHVRKGVAGDWQNYFTRQTAELFDRLAGDVLVTLGYEKDRGWIDRYDYVEA